jgi:hypothetical protein
MKYIILVLLLFTGCMKPQVITTPCPKPPEIAQPVLRVKSLTSDSTIAAVLKAYTLDLAEQVGYAEQLKALLAAYK